MKRSHLEALEVPEFILKDDPSCANVDPELFFPQEYEALNGRVNHVYKNYPQAKEICNKCPLVVDCLAYALKNGEIGIWGGTTEEQRKNLRRRYRMGQVKQYKTPITW